VPAPAPEGLLEVEEEARLATLEGEKRRLNKNSRGEMDGLVLNGRGYSGGVSERSFGTASLPSKAERLASLILSQYQVTFVRGNARGETELRVGVSGVNDVGAGGCRDTAEGRKGCDDGMRSRLQKERLVGGFIPSEREYYHRYGLDAEKLAHAAPDAIVMHPGPMNRGLEISGDVPDLPQSVIEKQVTNGVAVRMAVLYLLLGAEG